MSRLEETELLLSFKIVNRFGAMYVAAFVSAFRFLQLFFPPLTVLMFRGKRSSISRRGPGKLVPQRGVFKPFPALHL